ncbi:MAG TPA: efflux RND transporter periplasmic adaptor subunit [Gemmatimonadota bacterium]|nr:efflux RND transporter periplasmic adaptor subunit [Gemmatimonadota bacterium]
MAVLTTIRAAGALALAILAMAGCGGGEAEGGPSGAVIDTVHVRGEDVASLVQAVGTVEADNQTAVAGEVRGQVSRILQDEGSRVSAGQPVIQIDPGPYRFAAQSAAADLARAEAQLSADEKQLERFDQLLEAGAVDRQTYDNLQARVESGRAAVQQARAAIGTAQWNLGKSTVRAPFAGTVARRHVQLGQTVDTQDELFDLVDDQPVKIRFAVPEIHAGRIEVGDRVEFRVRSDTVAVRIAAVDYVSPEIDAGSRTFEVTAVYTNPDRGARPGAYADVSVTTGVNENAPVVPEQALVTEGTKNYVYVLEDSTAHRREVEAGVRLEGMVEILRGLEVGEVAITAGQAGLQDGAAVRVVEPRETLQREP